MNKKENTNEAILRHVKAFFTKNWPIKIISLIFAVLLWSYVMMETNPSRTKLVSEVPVSFSGENELLERGLAVRGDHSEILKSATVRVSTELTNYSGLDASDISATVSLRSVSKADTYRLKINATAVDGTVLSISPSELVIEVDELATRVVPIEVEYSGELPDGYWKGEPTLGSQTISVSGPAVDVSTVTKAICTIDLNGRTASCNESVLLRYVDSSGDEVDSAFFIDQLPSVVVKMDILRTVTLSINTKDAVLGTDAIPSSYEVYDIVATPPAIRVAGPEEIIEALSGIEIEPIDVSGSTTSVQAAITVTAPEGTILLDDPAVNIYVDIREKEETAEFTGMSIGVKGLDKKYTATLSQPACDISVTGRIGLMRLLERGDVEVFVDLTGLEAGTHETALAVAFKSKAMQTELDWVLSTEKINVTIKE